ncbi:Tetraspanin [Pleurostoma richardsiae]|uniref:Tetraspanin n=1 Tax=Pleurostoma richardsiae TaxID=41990 RepID=A0AA38SC07_9PEZI|nr:Tetraspanin [Pleurostoma richardsiae]
MGNKVLYAYVAADALFVIMAAIMLGFSVIVSRTKNEVPTEGGQAARNLLYRQFPLTAGIVNAVFMFVTFMATIPAIVMPTRGWLKFSGYLVTVCAIFTVVLGLDMWILTLRSKENLFPLWTAQDSTVQDLMQTTFACCGYFNSTTPAFVTDTTCPSPAAAAMMRGCAAPIASFANVFVDDIFTAAFGMAGIDGVLIMATACLLKDRKEAERFRDIDEKAGPMSSF